VNRHRGFETELFNRNDANWQIRAVLSSYSFMNNGGMGIPDGKSDCSKCVGSSCNSCSKSVPFSPAFDANSCGYSCVQNGQWKEGVYTRVHRDYDIIQAMRNWQGLPSVTDPVALGLPSNCRSSYLQEEKPFLAQE
jgi:alpha-amylase